MTSLGSANTRRRCILRGAGASDVADGGQSWVSSLHCYVCPQKPLFCVKCLFNFHCQKEKEWFHFFLSSLWLPTPTHAEHEHDVILTQTGIQKIYRDILVRLKVYSSECLCHDPVRWLTPADHWVLCTSTWLWTRYNSRAWERKKMKKRAIEMMQWSASQCEDSDVATSAASLVQRLKRRAYR